MKAWLENLRQRPWVAHLERTFTRFGSRLGSQFAAAITYFSILSIVPVLMFAFAVLGMTLTVFRPDLLAAVHELITSSLAGGDLGPTLIAVVDQALNNWGAIGLIGVLTAGWSGIGWVANLKGAVRAVSHPDGVPLGRPGNPIKEALDNLGILAAILVGMIITFAASSAATSLAELLTDAWGLGAVPGGGLLLRVLPLAFSLLTGFALFAFLYWVLPETPTPRAALLRGAAAGTVGLALLQYATGILFGVFGRNAAAALFGPVIVLMLFFNLFATLILLVAAWIATATVPVEPVALPEPEPEEAAEPEPAVVSQAVAQRAMGVGLGAGYALGAATGVGVGAVIASLARGVATLWRR